MSEKTVDNVHSSDADNVSSIEDQEIGHNVPNSDDEADDDIDTSANTEEDQEVTESDNGPKSVTEDEPDTFPREYVDKLRDENAKYRQRAQRSDELAHRLHRALVAADGRLADPTDLEFDDGHLEDADTLSEAIDGLLTTKPHLAARKPAGDIGQGAAGPNAGAVDLAGLLRAGAN